MLLVNQSIFYAHLFLSLASTPSFLLATDDVSPPVTDHFSLHTLSVSLVASASASQGSATAFAFVNVLVAMHDARNRSNSFTFSKHVSHIFLVILSFLSTWKTKKKIALKSFSVPLWNCMSNLLEFQRIGIFSHWIRSSFRQRCPE